MKKIISINQEQEWSHYVRNAYEADFYHSFNYHLLETSGEQLLFVFERYNDFIAFPLIKKEIPGTPHFDCTSVYGYCGPIASRSFDDLDDSFIHEFQDELLSFLKSEGIVSVFARLHPLLRQSKILHELGGLWKNGRVVVIDLKQTLEEQRGLYNRGLHQKIKQLRRKGYTVRETKEPEDIAFFAEHYMEHMRRIGAGNGYLFCSHYLTQLLTSQDTDIRLLIADDEFGTRTAGMILGITHEIAQAHLLTTNRDFLADSPAKLLIDEGTIIARECGATCFNLGSGLGYKEDSLFYWKAKFSKNTVDCYSWRYVVDSTVYNQLLEEWEIDPDLFVDHFPLYRINRQIA